MNYLNLLRRGGTFVSEFFPGTAVWKGSVGPTMLRILKSGLNSKVVDVMGLKRSKNNHNAELQRADPGRKVTR